MNIIHIIHSLHISALIDHLQMNIFHKLSQAQHIQSVIKISGKIVKLECVKCQLNSDRSYNHVTSDNRVSRIVIKIPLTIIRRKLYTCNKKLRKLPYKTYKNASLCLQRQSVLFNSRLGQWLGKVCSANPKRPATSSLEIRGYISVMAAMKSTYFF
jgi:hypothetical protein